MKPTKPMTAFDHEAQLERQLRVQRKLITLLLCAVIVASVWIALLIRDLRLVQASEEKTNDRLWEMHNNYVQLPRHGPSTTNQTQ